MCASISRIVYNLFPDSVIYFCMLKITKMELHVYQDAVISLCICFLIFAHGPLLLYIFFALIRFIFTCIFYICWLFIMGWMLHLVIVLISALYRWITNDWLKLKGVFEEHKMSGSTSTLVSSNVKRHLLTVMGSDITLVVGKGENLREFPIHKKVLSSVSEVAASMLKNPDTENQTVLRLPDEDPGTVELFIKFIYSNSWKTNLSLQEAFSLALFAEKYGIEVLKEKCRWFFVNDVLSEETACQMYELACHLNYSNLKELCLLIFITRTDAILCQETFIRCSSATVLWIVEQAYLNLLSGEIGLLVALSKWAKKKCQRKGIAVSGQNMCKVLQPFLPYINIAEIPPQDFLAEMKRSVLPESEALAFVEELFSAKAKCLLHSINFQRTKFCFEKTRIGVGDGRCKKLISVSNITIVVKVKNKDILLTAIQYLLDNKLASSGKEMRLTVRDMTENEYLLRNRKCKSFVIKNLKSCTHVLRAPYPLLMKANNVYKVICDFQGYVWQMNNKLSKDASTFIEILENSTRCIESFIIYSFVGGESTKHKRISA